MMHHEPIIVTGRGGMRGHVAAEHVGHRRGDDRVVVQLDRGGQLIVHPHELHRQPDGTYRLGDAGPSSREAEGARRAVQAEPGPPTHDVPDDQRIELAEERLHVSKRQVESRVRVHVKVEERQETVDMPLREDVVRVERVPINREVDSPPAVREEEGTLIVPVMEEVVDVRKKLMLREEVRLIREQSEAHRPQQVTLRREAAHVEREDKPDETLPGRGEEPASRSESHP